MNQKHSNSKQFFQKTFGASQKNVKLKSKKMKKLLLLILVVIMTAQLAIGQKKVLTTKDFKLWSHINSKSISNDGNWVAYSLDFYNAEAADVDERKLIIKHVVNQKKYEIPLASDLQFSDDSKWAAYYIGSSKEEVEKLKDKKLPVQRQAELINLESGEKILWTNVSRIEFSKGSSVLAITKSTSGKEVKHKGNDIILRDLNKEYDHFIGSISQFIFNKKGSHAAYVRDASGKTGNGIYLMDLQSGLRVPLEQDTAKYSSLKWSKKGSALVAYKAYQNDDKKNKKTKLVVISDATTEDFAKNIIDGAITDFPEGFEINVNSNPQWSEDGSIVFFGLKKKKEEKEEKPKNWKKEKKSDLDVWHWQDERIQSVQRIQAKRDGKKGIRYAYHVKSRKLVSLQDEVNENMLLTKDSKWGIIMNNKPYLSDHKPWRGDFYRVNTTSGKRDLIIKELQRHLGFSPDSKYFMYWKDAQIWSYNLAEGEHKNLTESAEVSFVNQEYDYPVEKPSYGLEGWSKDGIAVILRSRYDLWYQPLDGKPATNLTAGIGTEQEIIFRTVNLDKEELFIDLSKPLLMSAFGKWTKKSGFFRLEAESIGKSKPEKLIYQDKRISGLQFAKDANKYLITMETMSESPNVFISDDSFKKVKQMSNTNAQQADYIWGKRVLFDYTNSDGIKLQGMLTVPDTWKKGQKLPMIVSFYEKGSKNIHKYLFPEYARYAGTPSIEAVGLGFLLMEPDIHFNTRTTGDDFLDCLEAATKKVIEMGYVDSERIGLTGHSFAGYATNYVASRSTMFAAAISGAGVSNLWSDFNHLWGYSQDRKKGSGFNAHRYDINGQQRMGTNPHDDFDLYRDQSAVTYVKTMTTPLMILQGESDNTVAWIEAIEMYNAMRFNNKQVILLSYAKEGHGLGNLENKKDFHQRTQDYWDFHLKGESAADWLKNGIPFLDKKK